MCNETYLDHRKPRHVTRLCSLLFLQSRAHQQDQLFILESNLRQFLTPRTGAWGGGGYLTKFYTGRLYPDVQPLTLLYTMLAEKVLLLHTFY